MPHRILPYVSSHLANLIEGALLSILALCNGVAYVATAIADADWQKIFGPNGVAFVSVMATIILWGTFIRYQAQQRKDAIARENREEVRREREEKARERRHSEQVQASDKHASELKQLTVEAIKAQMIAAAESKSHSNNAQLLAIHVHDLCEVLKKSPCLSTQQLREVPSVGLPKDSRL